MCEDLDESIPIFEQIEYALFDDLTLAKTIFGPDAETFLPILRPFAESVNIIDYVYTPLDEFMKILKVQGDIGRSQQIYWREILLRAHFTATTTLLRQHKWISGVLLGTAFHNLFMFATSFRGFIESAADSVEALEHVPLLLAERSEFIKKAVAGKADYIDTTDVEEQLIHYSHARKEAKPEKLPVVHKAKASRDYLTKLQGSPNGEIHECYSWLCEFSHPSSATLGFMLEKNDDTTVRLAASPTDMIFIGQFSNRFRPIMRKVFTFGFTPALLTLKVLNALPLQELHTPLINRFDYTEIPLWQKMVKHLKPEPSPAKNKNKIKKS